MDYKKRIFEEMWISEIYKKMEVFIYHLFRHQFNIRMTFNDF